MEYPFTAAPDGPLPDDWTPPKLCQHEGCGREGFDCFLPLEDEPNGYYCGEHAAEQGFCCICGMFSAGIESFDFLHPGFCDNCHSELEEYDDSDLEFYE